MATFAERLNEALKFNNMTAAELCRKTKTPESVMSQYRAGKYVAKQKRLELYAKTLNVSIPWLMGENVSKERPANSGEQIVEDYYLLNRALSQFPTTDTSILHTGMISKAMCKVMELNNAILDTPRACIGIDETDAVIGLKFMLTYYHIQWRDIADEDFIKIVNSSITKNFLTDIVKLVSK